MRVYNFSAGPAVLPEEVLREAADEMLDYKGTGMSVMEMSHRSKAYDAIIKEAEKDIREIMNIPDNYKVLFLQGGASQQFAAVPMNLMKNKKAAYIITGQWAKKAYQEQRSTATQLQWLPPQTRPSPLSPTAPISISPRTLTMFTSARTTPSTAPSSRPSPTQRVTHWLLMCPPASCQSRLTLQSTALSTAAFRRT